MKLLDPIEPFVSDDGLNGTERLNGLRRTVALWNFWNSKA